MMMSKGKTVEDVDLELKPNRGVRTQIIEILKKQYGYFCFLCNGPFSKDEEPTIDHWYPQSAGGTWHISNLRLAHAYCNNKKGSIIPNADGTIDWPVREPKAKKVPRPEICNHCESGRILLIGETCEFCGSGPQPRMFPTANKKKVKNCTHSGIDHCWNCVLGFVERK